MKSGLSSRIRWYPSTVASSMSRSNKARPTPPPMGRLDVHPLDLRGAGSNPAQTRDANCNVAVERKQKVSVARLELRNAGEVLLNDRLDRKPKPVPRLHLIVAPEKVLQPQAADGFTIAGQLCLSDQRHDRSLSRERLHSEADGATHAGAVVRAIPSGIPAESAYCQSRSPVDWSGTVLRVRRERPLARRRAAASSPSGR